MYFRIIARTDRRNSEVSQFQSSNTGCVND